MTHKRTIMAIIFLIVLPFTLITVHATETIEVEAGKTAQRTIDLIAGDNVTGTVTCIDAEHGYNSTVDFWINRPDGSLILNTRHRDTKGGSFSFIAEEDGVYTLWLANFNWAATCNAVKVTVDYLISNPANSIFSSSTPYIIMTIIASALAVIFAITAFRKGKRSLPPRADSSRARGVFRCVV